MSTTTLEINSQGQEIPGTLTTIDPDAGSCSGQVKHQNLQMTFTPSRRKTVKKINVLIEGDFSIVNIQFAKAQFGKLLQQFDLVSLSLKAITELDLTALQLLHCFHIEATHQQKTLVVESEIGKEHREILVNAGLIDIISKRK